MKMNPFHCLCRSDAATRRPWRCAAVIAVLLAVSPAEAQFTSFRIGITRDQTNAVITWSEPDVQLQRATNVGGPYLALQGATSPFRTVIGTSSAFFRLQKTGAGQGGGVRGSLFVELPMATIGAAIFDQIFLPDLSVYLHNTTTAVDSPPVVSDLYGRYAFPRQSPGVYRLRWAAQLGWAAGQHPDLIVIDTGTQYPLSARVVANETNGVIFGRVKFADGAVPWFFDELFAENRTALVTVLNAARTVTLAGPVHANAVGWYAAAGLPRGVDVSLRARTEAATTTRLVPAAAISFGGPVATSDVELPNHKPEVITVVPKRGGVVVKTAPAGSTLDLEALTRDLDGDPLTYDWRALPGEGSLSPTSGSSVQWTLPAAGPHFVYLEVKDGRGGYAVHRVDFVSDRVETIFSGRAVDKRTGAPVGGAGVSVNGTATTTDANGFFLVRSPLARRYVLNITRTGYGLFSRVVDSGETGQIWRLVPAQVEVVDPNNPIVLVDRRPEVERQTNGVIVRVPAGALVDALGNSPLGPLTSYLVTYNIADGETPGDWGALVGADEVNLISYGAGFVEFVDAAGTRYNLAPGTEGEVEVVPPATMLAGAPPGTPMWSYDEKDGYWKETGAGRFLGGKYVGKLRHFSAFNTDLALASAACLKVLLYPPLPTGVRLRMKDPTGVNFTQTFEFTLDRPLRGIYRVPANINVQLDLLDASGTPFGGDLVLEEIPGVGLPPPGNIVNSGPPIPPGLTLWPEEPYETCKLVILRLKVEAKPSVFLTFKDIGSDAQALAYYNAVDPSHLRDTLGAWWAVNGFIVDATTGWPKDATSPTPDPAVVRTSYLNNNDLGSGRDMYFRDLGAGRVAAFVSNYGLFDQNAGNADLAAARATPGATVCMEFSPVETLGSTPIVKFFVYQGGDGKAGALLRRSANLDTFGEKYVPNLCLNCHGGSYFPSSPPTFAEINMGARFRELDTATYKFPGFRNVPNAGEKDRFKSQNLLIKNAGAGCTAQAIRELITGWYPGASTDQDNNYTPPGWAGAPRSTLYHQVVKLSCRTCHVAFDDGTGAGALNWTTYDQLKSRRNNFNILRNIVLCDSNPNGSRFMPHAVITYRNFWLSASPHEPGVLRTYSDGTAWPIIGDCPP